MLIPQEAPCPQCGHPRREHEISLDADCLEQCTRCDCRATNLDTPQIVEWDPEAPPRPFDWNFALFMAVMQLDSAEGMFADTIDHWRPRWLLAPGEHEELREIELLVRELWARYGPKKPPPAQIGARNLAQENAAVDQYEKAADELKSVILRLAVTDEWRSYFPPAEHAKIERSRDMIIRHGGNVMYDGEDEPA